MPGKGIGGIVLRLCLGSVCAANAMHVYAQGHETVYPDASFLEYLASLEEVDGEWLGPEQMEYFSRDEDFPDVPESRIAPAPAPLSPEKEEKK